ncbi:MAG: hypothetical protein WCJ86_03260 [Candidatus Saccharibacteria bacterium]
MKIIELKGGVIMEFAQRGTQQSSSPTTSGSQVPTGSSRNSNSTSSRNNIMSLLSLIITGFLILSVIFYVVTGNNIGANNESKYVAGGQYQAVFLNGGQVYFGQITSLNTKFLRVQDIYYLRVNQTVQPKAGSTASNDVSLVKLGCELHGPTDAMLINRDQVIFWENLKTDGQVAKAVAEYKKANPNGQKCDTSTSAATPTTSKP